MSIHDLIDLLLHLNKHLQHVIQNHGTGPWIDGVLFAIISGPWLYALLFAIIFCETGLVVTPFLPGDSLIFLVGALAADGTLHPIWAVLVLIAAALSGDNVNYQFGHFLGPKVLAGRRRFLKKEYLDRTHRFFETYGGKTIILARFVPIVRTFAPFVAGVGAMTYLRFLVFCIAGAVLWVGLLMTGGYFFGGFKFVQDHFWVVELTIIIISVLPMGIEFLRHRKAPAPGAEPAPPPVVPEETP